MQKKTVLEKSETVMGDWKSKAIAINDNAGSSWRERALPALDSASQAVEPAVNPLIGKGYDSSYGGEDTILKALRDFFSAGHDDEAKGLLEAAGSKIGLRGLGGGFNEWRRETPEEKGESFKDVYQQRRDQTQIEKQAAYEENPLLHIGSQVGAGFLVPGGGSLIAGAKTLGGKLGAMAGTGAAFGGAYGSGDSQADLTEGEISDYAGDVLTGAGIGAGASVLGGAAANVAPKVFDKLTPSAKIAKEIVTNPIKFLKSFHRGMKNTNETALSGSLAAPEKIAGGFKEAIGKAKLADEAGDQLSDLAKISREVFNKAGDDLSDIAEESKMIVKSILLKDPKSTKIDVIGNSKIIDNMTDEEAVVFALIQDGDNPVKRWWATKSAIDAPGQLNAKEIGDVLALPSGTRQTARAFNNRDAARDMLGDLEQARDLFKNTRSARFGELQDAARQSYDPRITQQVVDEVQGAIKDAGKLKSVPGSVSNLLEDVNQMIQNGVGTKSQGLREGPLAAVDGAEHFNRLQQARELVDKKIKWASSNGEGPAEKILSDIRNQIDKTLKLSPDKLEADSLYRASKNVEKKFFGAMELRDKANNIEIDEGKLSKLFNDNDQAWRFRDALEEFKQFASREDLSPEFKEQAAVIAERLQTALDTKEQARKLMALRQRQGPTSPAIEGFKSKLGENSPLVDAMQSPAGFINQADNFLISVGDVIGKNPRTFNDREKAAVARMMVWRNKNPNHTQAEFNAMVKRLMAIENFKNP
jgi:hypothetical protein